MARVPSLDPVDLADGDLVRSVLQSGRTPNVYRALANNPPVLEGLRAYLGALWRETGLTERERELLILAVARAAGSTYEWHQHVRIARSIGIPDADILAVSVGDLARLDERESVLIDYATAVIAEAVDDTVHDAAIAEFDEATVVGAAALAAGYLGLARVLAALAVEPEEPFVGWELEDG